VWFAWGAENDEIEVPKKSAETGGHHVSMCRTELTEIPVLIPSIMLLHNLLLYWLVVWTLILSIL
jgi:hypothetical protein